MNVLSLFDGMACGMLALLKAGIQVNNYYAYEIDKYAVHTAQHNFPNIQEFGDVFNADFKQYEGIDYLIGGSPCTYWSIAQSPDKRETTASGMGWELFSQYVRALNEAKPKYFIYENNKSMAKAIYQSISETFGFEPIMINSALVSAQNRQRYYWVGKRNDDGSYSKVDVEQPEDRGILLRDVLDGYEPVNTTTDGESYALTATYYKAGTNPCSMFGEEKRRPRVAEPVACRCRGRKDKSGNGYAKYECRNDYKSNTLDTNSTNGNMVAEPVNKSIRVGIYPTSDGRMLNSQGMRIYSIDGKSVTQSAQGGGMGAKTGLYAAPIEFQDLIIRSNAHIAINNNAIRGVQNKNNASCAENFYEFTDTKANTLTTAHRPKIIDELSNYKYYGEACEWNDNGEPTKAISFADGKKYTVYTVKDGQITIKEKQYPIKLQDGYYIIRKLTVSECKRLQTVPEWYEFPVSNSQAYKMLGNGWTVDVIAHLLKYIE